MCSNTVLRFGLFSYGLPVYPEQANKKTQLCISGQLSVLLRVHISGNIFYPWIQNLAFA